MTENKRQGLIFDGDDTLWDSQVFYDEAKERFYEIVAGQGGLAKYSESSQFTVDDVMRLIDEIEVRNIEREGFSSESFSQALVQTYQTLSKQAGVAPSPPVSQLIRGLGDGVSRQRRSPLPGARETLAALSGHGRYTLVLYSGGDRTTQVRKLRQAGLEEFFEGRVHIVQRKDDDTLRNVIRAENLDIASSWIIGNGLRTEINPALRLGLNCIWFHHGEWAFDEAEEREPGHVYEVDALPEILEILELAESRAAKGKGAPPE
jgi:putative hydrolase of the HAD superfamily